MVHPKTDEQRQSLANAVSRSFLFKSLDKEQCQDVLDAMFEKKVLTKGGRGREVICCV